MITSRSAGPAVPLRSRRADSSSESPCRAGVVASAAAEVAPSAPPSSSSVGMRSSSETGFA